MVLKCNADVVGLPADILTVDQLKLSRKVYGQTRERLVAHYNPYNPLLANGSMTIVSVYYKAFVMIQHNTRGLYISDSCIWTMDINSGE